MPQPVGASQKLDNQECGSPGSWCPGRDAKTITAFLLVPYFGACIHVPPPTNRVICVELPQGGAGG